MSGKINARLFPGGLIMPSIKQLLCFVYSCPFFPLVIPPPLFFFFIKEHLKIYDVKKGHGLRNRLQETYWPSLAGLGKSSHHRKKLPGADSAEVWAQQCGLGVSTFLAFC